ncbi:nucleotidyltransferase family protein [Colwellia psychrerythraea]|uniref:Nitrate reductase n=1 Tax=Colwellia psychrerythraea TaxID=28229 RepID=A0A099KQ28_COLPS|nr:nucleotidyltransferase family protein [Colwellia psychrerythraea]KGJ91738.1 protein of unknown function DUF925 [Colwellia psychrerythraea]
MDKNTQKPTQLTTQLISQLMTQDSLRLQALESVRVLDLPDGYIAAGFVRNLVWDHLHHKALPSPLNDIDVIYFDLDESHINKYKDYQQALNIMMPEVNWQVRNQTLMHSRNGDQPYKSSLHAMSYWPEKETAVAIRKLPSGDFECITAFGFESLFNLQLTHNPKREKSVFEQRIKSKAWLKHWPKLTLTP